jgi:N6-L-threonylcarbamoyladenine synthase
MQKLQEKLKNTPRNTSLVPCSVSSGLNKEETLSDQSKVLTCNNSEENLQQHGVGSNLRVLNTVYVLNKRGQPLMPTCQSRARRLLSEGKAIVVKRYPFTIKLTIATGETKQEVILGIDTGYQKVGISAISNKQELFAAEVTLKNNIVKLLSEKRMYRRNRRSKNHWYRKPRFNNRNKSSLWLAPSMQHKVDSHVNIVEKISKILPISKIIVESAKFDIQKINNPEIQNKEYQNGVQKDFWNVREYVLYRDKHTCQYCKKNNLILNVHHIVSRQTGGNRPDNLITLCNKCHKKYHEDKIKLDIKIKNDFRSETCMSIIRKRIISDLI